MKIRLKGVPIVVSAPSGAGKTTLINKLISKLYKEIAYSISATTRPSRRNEKDGVNYFFLSKEEFKRWIDEGKFIEWAQVHNHYYGTPKKMFKETLKKGYNIIMDLDVQGGINIKKRYPDGIYIFILTKNVDILKRRLTRRKTDTEESINERIKNAREELRFIKEYDYVVINDTIKKTIDTILAILIAEGCLTKRNSSIIRLFKKNL
ncbi:MAG: guanylate kinase [Candidatus Cloacimonadota bacterium]|nr:MAG: guanylate kinase [Candidatus Cloacimonadota bacterium]